MTDRELLEKAARAAGVTHPDVLRTHMTSGWNPLVDDGDALRLAVKALNWPHGGRAFDNQVAAMFAVGKLPSDPYAATRLAITMAAASLDTQ